MARLALANFAGEVAGGLSKVLKRGRGETIKGRAILAFDPSAIAKLAKNRDIVLVSGTNGKTTTTANLAKILTLGTDEQVSTSQYGANMSAGIAATLAAKPRNRFVVLECNELYLPTIGGRRHPDAATCPNCSAILDWSLGDYVCKCGLGSKLPQIRADKRLSGPARNAVLAIEAARLMGAIVPVELQEELTANPPDRINTFKFAGRNVPTRLAKNPESWRVGLTNTKAKQVILALNARGIDGRDTSWLWDIDFSQLLDKQVICVGERKLDIAYRLSVQGISVTTADSFVAAVNQFSEQEIEAIASYTAFQDLAASELGIHTKTGVDR